MQSCVCVNLRVIGFAVRVRVSVCVCGEVGDAGVVSRRNATAVERVGRESLGARAHAIGGPWNHAGCLSDTITTYLHSCLIVASPRSLYPRMEPVEDSEFVPPQRSVSFYSPRSKPLLTSPERTRVAPTPRFPSTPSASTPDARYAFLAAQLAKHRGAGLQSVVVAVAFLSLNL